MDDISALSGDQKLIYSMISQYATTYVRALVVDVKGTAAKINVDGTELPMYYPMLKQTYPITPGDYVEVLKMGEGYLILGETDVAADTGDPRTSLAERILALEQWRTRPEGFCSADRADTLENRISALEDFRGRSQGFAAAGHGHTWTDMPADGVHDNDLHDPNYAPAGHDHQWADLPHKGVHDNSQHSPNFATDPHGNAQHQPNFQPA